MASIVIYFNGSSRNGKIFKLPTPEIPHWTFICNVCTRFKNNAIKRLFTKEGHEIVDLDLLREGDILFAAANDDPFIPLRNAVQVPAAGQSIRESKKTVANSDFVHLNVGGTIFVTSKTTLISGDPNSILAKMFDPDSELPPARLDKNGAYLLDRDPKYFAPILNFLRTGTLVIDQGINPIGVIEEAVFFGIQACIPAGYMSSGKATMQDALDQYDLSKSKAQKQLSDAKEIEKIKLQMQLLKLSLEARDVQIREMKYTAKFTLSDSAKSKGYGPNLASDGDVSGVAYQLASLGSKCKNL